MQVQPQTPLPLVYQIEDHTDADRDTYYVRAVVRDSLTGGIIQSKNLTSSGVGTGRYSSQFNAPADISGLGRQIDVTTTVYTDNTYATKHPSYAEVLERWYVKDAPVHYSGGGASIDYEYLVKMIAEALATEDAEEEAEPPEPIDLQPVHDHLARIEQIITDRPEQATVDLKPLHKAIEAVGKQIGALPAPAEAVDLQPVHDAIAGSESRLHDHIATVPERDLSTATEAVRKAGEHLGGKIDGQTEGLKSAITGTLKDLYTKDKSNRAKTKQLVSSLLDEEDGAPPPTEKLKHPIFQKI